ncbi:MAG: DUF1553 domain-containing protein, partial [Verrucomicrobia bacterium]|nr:DUF1553 domain-containing protein [Verrucomicrobiota bacterium]
HGIQVTALFENGLERDVTQQARLQVTSGHVVALQPYGQLRPLGPGTCVLSARYEGYHAELSITVNPVSSVERPLTFVSDVLPALSRAGCSAGSCHAKPEGQNGFRLSVFAYDPKADHHEIAKEGFARRVFPSAPDESLIIQKPMGLVPHEGGKRFEPGSDMHQLLSQWIAEGMTYSVSNEPALKNIRVFPSARNYSRSSSQQLLVQASYSDGSVRDVTSLAAFSSNDKEIAQVSEEGLIRLGLISGQGVVVARYMGQVAASHVLIPSERQLPDSLYVGLPVRNFIDELAIAQFRRVGLLPSELCSDSEFIRRAKLDVIGMVPTASEARDFLRDTNSDKRDRIIDQFLEDPAYADFWANKWADLLRPNPDRVGVKSVFTLDQWLRDSFRANKSYDVFVKEVLLGEGSNHRNGPAVIYRDRREPADLTTMFSQLFLGTRLECARCHHHPNEKWGQEDFYQFAAFFGPVKQKGAGLSPPISAGVETFFFGPGGSVKHPVTGEVMAPKPPDGPAVSLPENRDPREGLIDWLTQPSNPFFAHAAVNRVWAAFFGRGLVDPVDDFRISNPCSNPELLDALARDFRQNNYDLKKLMRTIMQSKLYQLSSKPNEYNKADTRNFSRAYRRRLPAETLMDAVSDITGVSDTFAAMPASSRAVQAWSYKIDSHFMDAFGRPNSSSDCPCERDTQLSVVQSLHLMNSKALQSKLSNPKGTVALLVSSGRPAGDLVEELYLAALSRPPTDEEKRRALGAYSSTGATPKTATEDILWALLNSAEFVFNH